MSRLILVLGMHRSGTSAVAKSLTCLGASLGPRANWSGPDNPSGFFEDQDVLALNEAILGLMKTRWDDPFTLWHGEMLGINPFPLVQLLRERLARYPIFAIKEPRLCRLLPLWRKALQHVPCEVSVVHVNRHPLAVVASLEKRSGMPLDQSLALWLEYTQRARLDVDPSWPSVTVSYEAMMNNPMYQLLRISRGLHLPYDPAGAMRFAREFLDPGLWHHGMDFGPLPPDVATEYAIALERTAHNPQTMRNGAEDAGLDHRSIGG